MHKSLSPRRSATVRPFVRPRDETDSETAFLLNSVREKVKDGCESRLCPAFGLTVGSSYVARSPLQRKKRCHRLRDEGNVTFAFLDFQSERVLSELTSSTLHFTRTEWLESRDFAQQRRSVVVSCHLMLLCCPSSLLPLHCSGPPSLFPPGDLHSKRDMREGGAMEQRPNLAREKASESLFGEF